MTGKVSRCLACYGLIRTALVVLFQATLLVLPSPAAAAMPAVPSRVTDETVVAACIRQSAGGRGWLEKTLWGLRDQEGGWVGAEIANSNGSHDLGPLQVNSWWVPKIAAVTGRPAAHIRYWLKTDSCFNVEAARWIFLSALAVTKDYWRAVGVYHSPTGWRARHYAASVAGHLRRRYGTEVFGRRAGR